MVRLTAHDPQGDARAAQRAPARTYYPDPLRPASYSEGRTEGVGFEPTTLSGNGFQDRRLRPLGHPSVHSGC